MEGSVAVPIRMNKWPGLLVPSGVVGFEAKVEAEQEVGEIHAQAQAVGGCYLFVKFVELEHTAGLRGIVADGPDIARIDEDTDFEHPK